MSPRYGSGVGLAVGVAVSAGVAVRVARGASVVITAGLASRLFGTTSATGRRMVAGFASRVEAEIVGVVEDVRLGDPDDPLGPMFFRPYTDVPSNSVTVLARTRAGPAR